MVQSNVILAGTDRVAIDAVGVALLRHFGTTPEVSQGAIFEQEQIARAVELKIGVTSPKQIELVTGDPESAGVRKADPRSIGWRQSLVCRDLQHQLTKILTAEKFEQRVREGLQSSDNIFARL